MRAGPSGEALVLTPRRGGRERLEAGARRRARDTVLEEAQEAPELQLHRVGPERHRRVRATGDVDGGGGRRIPVHGDDARRDGREDRVLVGREHEKGIARLRRAESSSKGEEGRPSDGEERPA